MPTRLAEATRGGAVESIHDGVVAVVDVCGRLVASAGDPDHFAYFRSSAKPFQAVPLVESGAADAFGFTPAELALCCASHNATPAHQTQVAAMLAKIGLDAGALRCGAPLPGDDLEAARVEAGLVARSPLHCDCSGKHTGMLAACVHLGLPIDGYLDPNHSLQRRILSVVARLTRTPASELRLAIDGCDVPTFGAPVRAFAMAYATLASPESAAIGHGREHAEALLRLRDAMRAHPENVAGAGDLVTDLMRLSEGRIVAKSGAEGLLCLAVPDRGIGVAIRVLDGSFRAHPIVAGRVLAELDLVPGEVTRAVLARHDPRLLNHSGRHVGDLRAAFVLQR